MFNTDPYREKPLKIFLSETRRPRSLIFGKQLCLVDRYQDCSNWFKALLQLANFTLGPDATLNTETHKNSVRIKALNSVNTSKPLMISKKLN